MTNTYVVGHVNPDTDSIAAAVGYAWLLHARDGDQAIAARAGPLNLQTTWVLERLGIDPPLLLTDASPRFESVTRRFDSTTPDQPLREAWAIANRTGGVAPVVNEDGTPYGLITGWSLFSFLRSTLGPHPREQGETLAEILDSPCRNACDTDVHRFEEGARIRDSLNLILRTEDNDFWVVDKSGLYVGICRQRDLLNPPRLRVVMVDHNELNQAIRSLDEADLVEILDHHRLDNPSTRIPIRFSVDVVGSTSTLVSERMEEAGLRPPPDIAGLLLAGLLADTLILTSPTSTDRDIKASERIGRWAFIPQGPLAGESLNTFGEQLINAGANLITRDPEEVVTTDTKTYTAGDFRFAIAQAEVTNMFQLDEIKDDLYRALNELRERRALDFTMLMVTDVVGGGSRLLLSGAPVVLNELPYPLLADGTREAIGVVSRKKQLLPVIFSLLEG
jgi:manganese-dependent inorganic pyrophosphatase